MNERCWKKADDGINMWFSPEGSAYLYGRQTTCLNKPVEIPKWENACNVGSDPDPNSSFKDTRRYTRAECEGMDGWYDVIGERCWKSLQNGSKEVLGNKCPKPDPDVEVALKSQDSGVPIKEVMRTFYQSKELPVPKEFLEPTWFSRFGLEERNETYFMLVVGGGLGAVLLWRYMLRSRVVNPPVSK
jgi:hypothetical protein